MSAKGLKKFFYSYSFQIARWSKLWKLIQDGECDTCADFVVDSDLDLDPNSTFDLKVKRFLMDRSILKIHLPNGGFNMVKYGDATDVKVSHTVFEMSLVVRKLVFRVSDQVPHKPGCTSTQCC